jgi:hypothetical protein
MSLKTYLSSSSSYSTTNLSAANATTAPQHDTATSASKNAPGASGDAFSVLRGMGNFFGGLIDNAAKAGIIIVGGHDAAAKAGIIIVGGRSGGGNGVQKVRDAFDNKDKDLQNQDKLGNFEIQSLMSDYNEASTLASSVQKKQHETQSAVIGKI